MNDNAFSVKVYKTTVNGDWTQAVCKAKSTLAAPGDEASRIARQIQKQLGISYGAARHLVASMFTRRSG